MDDPKQAFAFVSCDGEESQIRVLTRAAVAKRFADQRIVVGKTPRSCSGICQAADISDGFKAEKKMLGNVEAEIFDNLLLKEALTRLFIQYKADNVSSTLTASKIKSYSSGLQAMTYVAQNVQTSRVVQEGYTQFGQKGSYVDTFKILSACRENIDIVESNKMMHNMAIMGALYKTHGEIDEKFYDDLALINH